MAAAIEAIKGAIEALEESKKGMVDAKTEFLQNLNRPGLVEKIVAARQHVSKPVLERIAADTAAKAKKIFALLEETLNGESTAPGKPAAYEYHSNDIIATLKGLLKTFKADKYELDTEEAAKQNDYEMEAQARANTIKFTGMDIDEKAKLSADKENEKAKTEQEKEQEVADMEADQAFMKDLTEQCETKAKDFDQRSKTRAAEITAITEAIEILKSGVQPNYSANKKLVLASASVPIKGHWVWVEDAPAPVGENAAAADKSTGATSFLQLRGTASGPIGKKVLDFITEKASLLQSPILSTLALKLKLGTAKDHFVKVRTMIKDLIAKLEADAEAEASQKAFCDEEMEQATTARDEAIGSVEESTAAIDEAESKIAKLTEEIATLSKEIGDLRKSLFEATELRAKEKAENEKTLADSEAGLEAVKNAISVLKDFYDNAFVQVQFVPKNAGRDGKTVADLAPGGPSGEYHGNQDAAKGIFGLLEVIQSDFERTIETVTKEEEDAQAEFEAYEKETNDSIEEKGKSKKDKETEKEDTEADLVGFKEDLKTAQEKLADAKEELEKLKPLCVDTGMSWKERRARQKQEIEALKQALAILEDWKQ